MYPDILQKREVFHLEFLRGLVRVLPVSSLVVKRGCNLRFFFGSERYSEDLDLDVTDVAVYAVKDAVMSVLNSAPLSATMRTYGIETVQPPDLARAKQTETVQRFKVHLMTAAGEDLSTKVEFSRRGMDGPVLSEPVLPKILAEYRLAPLILPHYGAQAAMRQKIEALATRRKPQPRDTYDLFVLSSRPEISEMDPARAFSPEQIHLALERVYAMEYEHFRDTVVSFLRPEDQSIHANSEMWDQIRLTAISILEKGEGDGK